MSTPHTWRVNVKGEIITIRAWPSRPFAAVKVFGEGYTKCAMNAKGELFHSSVRGNGYFSHPEGKSLSALNDLATLGAFPKKRFVALLAKLEAARSRRRETLRLGSSATELLDAARETGLTLLPAQLKKLRQLKAAGKRARG